MNVYLKKANQKPVYLLTWQGKEHSNLLSKSWKTVFLYMTFNIKHVITEDDLELYFAIDQCLTE